MSAQRRPGAGGRWLALLLIASLSLNMLSLALIAALAAAIWPVASWWWSDDGSWEIPAGTEFGPPRLPESAERPAPVDLDGGRHGALAAWAQTAAFAVRLDDDSRETSIWDNGTAFAIGGGYVVTNMHVVCDHVGLLRDGAVGPMRGMRLSMSRGGESRPLAYVGGVYDEEDDIDIAVLRFDGGNPGVAECAFAERPAQVGDEVLLVGAPVGNEGLAVFGRVSLLKGRHVVYDTDAVSGSSGGPVFDMNGDVVAVHAWAERFGEDGDGWDVGMSAELAASIVRSVIDEPRTIVNGERIGAQGAPGAQKPRRERALAEWVFPDGW